MCAIIGDLHRISAGIVLLIIIGVTFLTGTYLDVRFIVALIALSHVVSPIHPGPNRVTALGESIA